MSVTLLAQAGRQNREGLVKATVRILKKGLPRAPRVMSYCLVIGWLCFCASTELAYAQVTGALRGTISDAQGGVLPGVTVTATSPALVRGTVTAATDDKGEYRLPALQPGAYDVVAELSGFAKATISVVIGLEQEVVINLVLQVSALEETVNVSAEPLVDMTVAGLREGIGQSTIEGMPLRSREFLDLVTLVPGTAPRAAELDEGAGATVPGDRSTTSGFLIDGMQNKDNFSGGFREFFAQDAIQEFTVNVAGFQAEHGLATGAVINIITRSGTNDFKGRAFLFGRHDELASSNVPGQEAPALRRANVGGTVGGPLVRDRAWMFYALENLREARGSNLDRSVVPPIIASGYASPSFGGEEPFDAESTTDRLTQFVKVHQRLNKEHELLLSSNFNLRGSDGYLRPTGSGFIIPPRGSISLPSTGSDIRENVFSLNARETAFIGGNRGLIESTLRYVRGDYRENTERAAESNDEISLLTFQGGSRFWNTNFPLVGAQKTLDTRLEWSHVLSYFGAKHSAKFGFDYNRLSADGFFVTPILNVVANTLLESRYQELNIWEIPTSVTFQPILPVDGREGYDIHDTIYSLFGQDNWQIAPNVSIQAGVRWDYETLFQGSKNNIAPRLGLTWDPWRDGKTVIRASAGLFYDTGLLGPALLSPEHGGSTTGTFSFISMPEGGSFYNNPAIGAFGPLHGGGIRWLSNPPFFSFLQPAGVPFSSGGISMIGRGEPYVVYNLLGIPVADPRNPPILTAASIPVLTENRFTAQQALALLNSTFPSPFGFEQFFYIPPEFSGQVMREGTLAYKFKEPGVVHDDLHTIARPFETPYVISFNVGFDRQLFRDTSIDVEYFHRKGRDLLGRRVVNIRNDIRTADCAGNTTDGQPCNRQLGPVGFSNVNAVTIGLRKAMSQKYSYLLSYSYTHAIDNFNSPNVRTPISNFTYNNDLSQDIGRSLNTPEHVMAVSGVYQAPWSVEVSAVFRATSGRPFNAPGVQGQPANDGATYGATRYPGTAKGEFLTDPFAQLDVRFAKVVGPPSWRLMLLAEVFNLTNRRNPLQVNTQFGPTIGQTVEPLPGREWQFGLRLDF